MTPQTVTIRIPRKQSERIQFSKELYDKNPQEWEVETRQGEPAQILTTEWNDDCCVVYNTKHYGGECTLDGFYYPSKQESCRDLFMRRKSDEKLPEDEWMNLYRKIKISYTTKDDANKNASNDRIALVHVTYAWEDQP